MTTETETTGTETTTETETTETALQSLQSLCLSENISDVNFSLNHGKIKLPAHKVVLAMRSEVFKTMFYGSTKKKKTDEIKIDDIKEEVLKNVLRYAYTDTIEVEGTDIVECLYAATKYSLHGLVAKCSEEMNSFMSSANACTLYEQTQSYKVEKCADTCFTYILENDDEVMKTPDFCSLSLESLCRVLCEDEICTPEIDIFKALQKWAVSKENISETNANGIRRKDQGISLTDIRQIMGDALFLVRLPLVPVKAFTDIVVKSKILTSDETANIYEYMATIDNDITYEHDTPGKVGKFSSLPRKGKLRKETTFKPTRPTRSCEVK